MSISPSGQGEFLLYTTPDERVRVEIRLQDETLWLTQKLMAELFGVDVRTVNEHLGNIYASGELLREPTIRKFRIVRQEGSREVSREIDHYNLDAIISVGYRVNSIRGTQFRIWATQRLREYLVKGYVLDDERLKNPDGRPDYFDEMLARIRDIRASEKRFYQKVRDLFSLSIDYDKSDRTTQQFFAKVQNQLLYAVTQQTAAELFTARANPNDTHFGLLSWKGEQVRKEDILIAKNYLTEDELDTLNRLVVIFLETAELRAKNRTETRMAFWQENVEQIIATNGFPLLQHAGSISHEAMKRQTTEHYQLFDARRKAAEALQADRDDENELKQLEQQLKRRKSN